MTTEVATTSEPIEPEVEVLPALKGADRVEPKFRSPDELADLLENALSRISELEKTSGKGLQVQLAQMQERMASPAYVVELYKPGGRGQAMSILAVSSFAGTVKIVVAPVDPARPLPLPDFVP